MKRIAILAASAVLVVAPAVGIMSAQAQDDRGNDHVHASARHGEAEPGDDHGGRHGGHPGHRHGDRHGGRGADDPRGHHRHGGAEPGDDHGGRHGGRHGHRQGGHGADD